ncbi:MAG TPA: 2-oxoacid:acceptor oxidoreductase family protein [Bacillota bacterium]|nr:2-oxoacid:acceptor oxidoreductase family protein [Bacillota bacterium]
MAERIIMAGFGGQGVMSMGQLLTYAGMLEGKNVSWLPSYGPEMRGGTSNCNVIISDAPVGSPIVTSATTVIALNRPSLDKFEATLEPGGFLFINSSLVDRRVERDDIRVFYIPANEIAQELGNIRVANSVVLGVYLRAVSNIKSESVIEALKSVLGPSKQELVPINEQAMKRGAALLEG